MPHCLYQTVNSIFLFFFLYIFPTAVEVCILVINHAAVLSEDFYEIKYCDCPSFFIYFLMLGGGERLKVERYFGAKIRTTFFNNCLGSSYNV